jgi:ribose 5-phosphate isomerase B
MKIAIGNDHAGPELKQLVFKRFEQHEFLNFGTDNLDSVDYPDHVHPVAEAVVSGDADLGILICGSGNGVCMTANKHHGIRAALCWNTDLAKLARQHNNANIICIPARFVDSELSLQMIELFLTTQFEGGRHATRVDKINC